MSGQLLLERRNATPLPLNVTPSVGQQRRDTCLIDTLSLKAGPNGVSGLLPQPMSG
jgi:hypothetical protein